MSETEKPTAAFILSLIGGIFILLGGGMRSMMVSYGFSSMMSDYWRYDGMMSQYGWEHGPGFGMMGRYAFGGIFGLVSVLFGVSVIVGALMLYNNPAQHTKWSIVILIFSVLSIFATAGFGTGFILGIIGGILALAWKPPKKNESS